MVDGRWSTRTRRLEVGGWGVGGWKVRRTRWALPRWARIAPAGSRLGVAHRAGSLVQQRPKTPHAIDLHGARSGAGFRGDPGDAPPRVVAHEPQQGDDAGASPRSPARRLH